MDVAGVVLCYLADPFAEKDEVVFEGECAGGDGAVEGENVGGERGEDVLGEGDEGLDGGVE